MSGLKRWHPDLTYGGNQVQQSEIDQYDLIAVDSPSTSASWFAAGTSTGTAVAALVQSQQLADWPRNVLYQTTGGTTGGTFTANLIDQFGQPQVETVAIATAAAGGSAFGTVIAAKFISGTVNPIAANQGTYTAGFGTVTNGSATSNWFGLLTKIGGTGDLKVLTWINNTTPTGLNKGTAIGTLINTTTHAFQGTSGVAATDHYRVVIKPSFDASAQGTMCAL